tara:strand:+ start:305 stop:679 length:375 start_codon:yes stop_codon:yes gene_type:complete
MEATVYKENANFYIQFAGEEYGTLCNILEKITENGYDSYDGYRISNIEEKIMTIIPPPDHTEQQIQTIQLDAAEENELEEFKLAVDNWNNEGRNYSDENYSKEPESKGNFLAIFKHAGTSKLRL